MHARVVLKVGNVERYPILGVWNGGVPLYNISSLEKRSDSINMNNTHVATTKMLNLSYNNVLMRSQRLV